MHFIRKKLVGKTLSVVKTQEDANVYGKVGTSASEFQKALTGKKVVSAGSQGKYFWMIMSEPPHPVMHFGMNGKHVEFSCESRIDKVQVGSSSVASIHQSTLRSQENPKNGHQNTGSLHSRPRKSQKLRRRLQTRDGSPELDLLIVLETIFGTSHR